VSVAIGVEAAFGFSFGVGMAVEVPVGSQAVGTTAASVGLLVLLEHATNDATKRTMSTGQEALDNVSETPLYVLFNDKTRLTASFSRVAAYPVSYSLPQHETAI
jgi:hypothetical protein